MIRCPNFGEMPERLIGPASKAVRVKAHGGSNPSLSSMELRHIVVIALPDYFVVGESDLADPSWSAWLDGHEVKGVKSFYASSWQPQEYPKTWLPSTFSVVTRGISSSG